MDLLKKFFHETNSADLVSAFVFFSKEGSLNVDILSSKELEIFSKFTSLKRQVEFIAGRKAAKTALFEFKKKKSKRKFANWYNKSQNEIFESPSLVSVLPSNTGSPFIENSDLNVSISHSHGIAVASVSQNPIGIDIEKVNPKKISVLKHITPSMDQSVMDASILTIFWTFKEALSKALKTGIIESFEYYDLKDLRYTKLNTKQSTNQIIHCRFKNFPEYFGTAITDGKYAIAIVEKTNNRK